MSTAEPLLDTPDYADETNAEFQTPPGRKTWVQQVLLTVFLVVPFAALAAAIPVAWGWGLSWRDAVIASAMYAISGLGVTVGFHRYLTHRSFRAKRPLRIALAIAGSLALQASVIQWVADHRRHHRFSDREGDPHSPWRYGTGMAALAKGFFYSHVGWLYDWERTDEERYAPELVADRDINWVSRMFPTWVVVSMLAPALVGGLWAWSWQGAVTAFFWGSLARVCLLHHVTFAINSVCHITGRRPFRTRDRSRNVWWLALLSFGESWHNFHHAEPTSARHGVRLLEIDTSAMLIKVMEKLRWINDVRWPDRAVIARRRMVAGAAG
ncbi:MAG: acyl-CoA desaturase [Acidimicrobiales bacterium]|nr:acyl-CoA desaturase [Acidimicrobiales bacterium]